MKKTKILLFSIILFLSTFYFLAIIGKNDEYLDLSFLETSCSNQIKYRAFLNSSVEIIKNNGEWNQIEIYFGQEINGSGVTVAVLDSGIDLNHPDLKDRVINSISFVSGENASDFYGHGTHIAGIIAGTGNVSSDLIGVAPSVSLLNVKVLDKNGAGIEQNITDGIQWAVIQGADVINLSLGANETGDGTDPLSQWIDWAVKQGVVVVTAAGNMNGYYNISSPGTSNLGITVGASDDLDNIYSNSFGPTLDFRCKPDIIAPGKDIISCRANNTPLLGNWGDDYYQQVSGTSMACAHVAGVCALLLQQHPSWSPWQIKSALMNNAEIINPDPFKQGAGRIDAPQAINTTVFINGSLDYKLGGPNLLKTCDLFILNNGSFPISIIMANEKEIFSPSEYPIDLNSGESTKTLIYFGPGQITSFFYFDFLNLSLGGNTIHTVLTAICPNHTEINFTSSNLKLLIKGRVEINQPNYNYSEIKVRVHDYYKGTQYLLIESNLNGSGYYNVSCNMKGLGENVIRVRFFDGENNEIYTYVKGFFPSGDPAILILFIMTWKFPDLFIIGLITGLSSALPIVIGVIVYEKILHRPSRPQKKIIRKRLTTNYKTLRLENLGEWLGEKKKSESYRKAIQRIEDTLAVLNYKNVPDKLIVKAFKLLINYYEKIGQYQDALSNGEFLIRYFKANNNTKEASNLEKKIEHITKTFNREKKSS